MPYYETPYGRPIWRPEDMDEIQSEGVYTPYNPLYGRGKQLGELANRVDSGGNERSGKSRVTDEQFLKAFGLWALGAAGGMYANAAMGAGGAAAPAAASSSQSLTPIASQGFEGAGGALGAGWTTGGTASGAAAGGGLAAESVAPLAVGQSGAQTAALSPMATGTGSSVSVGGSATTASKLAAAYAKYKPYANAALQAYNAYSAANEAKKGAKGATEQYRTPYGNAYIAPLIRYILDQQARIYNQRQAIYGGPQMSLSPIMAILAGVPAGYSGVGKP